MSRRKKPQSVYDAKTYGLVLKAEAAKGSTRLKAERLARGMKQKDVADQIGTNAANLLRIEAGTQTPKRPLAQGLYDFYDGAVPLGACYDPIFAKQRSLDGLSR